MKTLNWHLLNYQSSEASSRPCILRYTPASITVISMHLTQWKRVNVCMVSIVPHPTVFSLLSFPFYSTLSVQFTACLHLTKKPALNCKDKGTNLISYCYASRVCKTLALFEVKHSRAATVFEVFWVKCQSFLRSYVHSSLLLGPQCHRRTGKCFSVRPCMG